MKDVILVINCGSSSIKFRVFENNDSLDLLANGRITGIGSNPVLSVKGLEDEELPKSLPLAKAINRVIKWVQDHDDDWNLIAAGHRVVHGGNKFKEPVVIDRNVVEQLSNFIPLAPLHMPYNLEAIEVLEEAYQNVKQVACFDTAFHSNLEPLHYLYAIPHYYEEQGIRKYGFHGLSYEWIVNTLEEKNPELLKGKVVAAHLGNGASLCAINNGKSIDTTMGMTAIEGLPMGTRCGSIDPGVVLYMIRQMALPADKVEKILSKQSGLYALSEISNDVRQLRESNDKKAQFALDYFALKVAQNIANLSVSLGGVDGIVFTGGIGENDALMRDAIMKHLTHLGKIETLVVEANEERMIAKHVRKSL